MTLEEYEKVKDEITAKMEEIREAYRAARWPLEAQLAEAKQIAIDAAPFKVGDVVLAKHHRGVSWNDRPLEKCRITQVAIDEWWTGDTYGYRGVKTKKDGTFANQEDQLTEVQPYDEREDAK